METHSPIFLIIFVALSLLSDLCFLDHGRKGPLAIMWNALPGARRLAQPYSVHERCQEGPRKQRRALSASWKQRSCFSVVESER
jgi:hypothetical protein